MNGHTPEPWRTRIDPMYDAHLAKDEPASEGKCWPLHYGEEDPEADGDPLIGLTFTHADARRAVAAVNACQGIPTETLEHLHPETQLEIKMLTARYVEFSERLAEAERLLRWICPQEGLLKERDYFAAEDWLQQARAFLEQSS